MGRISKGHEFASIQQVFVLAVLSDDFLGVLGPILCNIIKAMSGGCAVPSGSDAYGKLYPEKSSDGEPTACRAMHAVCAVCARGGGCAAQRREVMTLLGNKV